jgi:hypothetical protein
MTRMLCALLAAMLPLIGCESADNVNMNGDDDVNGTDTDTGTDTETAADTDADGDSDGDSDTGQDGDAGLIEPDCSACTGVGTAIENMSCAIGLCDPAVLLDQTYSSPTIAKQAKLDKSRAAVAHFGAASNDLDSRYPKVKPSYVVMSSGYAVPANPPGDYDHNQVLNSGTLMDTYAPGIKDPFAPYEYKSYDVVEWKLHLKAPAEAHGFQINYVFFSEEYDEYVGQAFNDKFYMILEAPSTNGGDPTIINFTQCRPNITQPDFVCPADSPACDEGDELCYLAINSGLSECCWFDGCTTADQNTDITGTGFECGTAAEDFVGNYSYGFTFGSSTGWLKTAWPIEPGEEFTLTFHVHDTADGILDSEVLIDKLLFVGTSDAGTVPVE